MRRERAKHDHTNLATRGGKTSDARDNEVVLDVRNLTKHFPVGSAFRPRYVHALNDATFTIARRQVVALVGELGSGKSTTARLIARLMPPTRGQILLHGQDVLKTEPRRASLSLPQSGADDLPGPLWFAQPRTDDRLCGRSPDGA